MQNILKKLHDIMSEVDSIPKDKTNSFHGYDYASEYAIKTKLHGLLVKHKVLFMLSATDIRHTGTLTDVICTFKFFDIESGEVLEAPFVGTGEDKLDKGTYKAITGAIKYILTSTFLIPTGDDPENDKKPNVAKAEKLTPTTVTSKLEPCKVCGSQYKLIPAGTSKAGKPYGAFYACSKRGCSGKTFKAEEANMMTKPEYREPEFDELKMDYESYT